MIKDENIWCQIVEQNLEEYKPLVYQWNLNEKGGAIVTFDGITRNNFENKEVLTLSYECYKDMAISEMYTICSETFLKFKGILKIALLHANNEVGVKGLSVICSVTGEHRVEAFRGCEYIMNELKGRVPIWKKEIYKDGNSEWKENKEFLKHI